MKAKILLAIFVALLNTAASQAESYPEAPILRNVKVTGLIRKFGVKYEDNDLKVINENVCEVSSQVPLYDLRDAFGMTFNPTTLAKCKADIEGKPVEVVISSYMAINNWVSQDGRKDNSKMAQAVLYVRDKDGTNATIPELHGSMGTKDVNEQSLLMFLSQTGVGGSLPANSEYFIATLEFQDSGK